MFVRFVLAVAGHCAPVDVGSKRSLARASVRSNRATASVPIKVRMLRAVHTPPSARASCAAMAPHPPLRRLRSRILVAVSMSCLNKSTHFWSRLTYVACGVGSGSPSLAAPITRNAAPAVNRTPGSIRDVRRQRRSVSIVCWTSLGFNTTPWCTQRPAQFGCYQVGIRRRTDHEIPRVAICADNPRRALLSGQRVIELVRSRCLLEFSFASIYLRCPVQRQTPGLSPYIEGERSGANKPQAQARLWEAQASLRLVAARARAFRSRCPLHRKRESQRDVIGCKTLPS